MTRTTTGYKKFYESVDREELYAKDRSYDPKTDVFLHELSAFVKKYHLENGKALEIGSGTGRYQDIVEDYTGVDIASSLRRYYHKHFVALKKDEGLPFPDDSFNFVFTRAAFEHIPDIDFMLSEILRVLRKGGYIFFHMAWQVRPWAAKGYEVRPYSDLDLKGKAIKALIPVFDSVFFRSLSIFPKRLLRTVKFILNRDKFSRALEYKKLEPNYEKFYGADSDACNSVDPHSMIIYFMANNWKVTDYPNLFKAFFVRTGILRAEGERN